MRRRSALVVVALALSAASVASLSQAELQTDMLKLFLDDEPPAEDFRELQRTFGLPETVLLAWPTEDALSEDSVRAQVALERELVRLPWVATTLTAASLPSIVDEGGLAVRTWGDRLRAADTTERDALIVALAAAPHARGVLFSDDRRAAAAAIQLRPGATLDVDVQAALSTALRAAATGTVVDDPADAHLIGMPVFSSALLDVTLKHVTTLLPITVLLLLMVVFVLFGSLWPAVVTTLVGGLAALWSIAVAVAIDGELTVLHAVSPALVFVISLADTIFLLHAVERARQSGLERREAVVHAAGEVGTACLLTSLSTFFGFSSLLLIPTPATRIIGLTTGLGVALALGLVLTAGPALLDVLPEPKREQRSWVARLIDGVVERARRLAMARPIGVLVFCAALFALCGLALTQLEVETEWTRRLPAEHPLSRSQTFVQGHLSADSPVEIALFVEQGQALSPEVLAGVDRVSAALAAHPDVIAVSSIKDVLVSVHQTLTGEQAPPLDEWSSTRAPQYFGLLGLAADSAELERLVTAKRDAVRIVVELPPMGMLRTAAVSDELQARANTAWQAGATKPQARIVVSGLTVMIGRWLRVGYAAQLRGFLLMLVITALLLAVGLRSLRTGLVATCPNLLPVALVVGSLAWLGQAFDSDYIIIVLVGLGLCVDDTIHFLTRFAAARAQGADVEAAIAHAYASAGPAMVLTTLVLIVGLSPLLLSGYLSTSMFSTELTKILLGALLADLLCVPALLRLGLMHPRAPSSRAQ